MEVPIGFLAKLWSFISFLPVFLLLFILGVIKAALFGPISAIIIFTGNSAVVIGLWPAHFLWTYYCVAKTKRLGLTLKVFVLVTLPLPLVLWPVIGVTGNLLVGIGYGFFTPLIATFEATGENVKEKIVRYFVDGSWSTVEGSCTIVVDFTDFFFHSYFSFMDELSEQVPDDEKPMDIKLLKLPSCLLVSLLAIPVDVLLITAVALCKSPYMLFKGWKRLLEDLIGREGPFLETVCVPFAGLAIILWPLAVLAGVISAFISSFFLGFYAGVIAHQEDSLRMGLAYIVSVVSMFDEYTNDLLYFREGSCLPRPKYRRNMITSSSLHERTLSIEKESNHWNSERVVSHGSKLVSEKSKLKWAIQQLRPVQVWDWLFRSCEVNGRILLREGLIDVKDIEECILKGKCKKLGIKLPAWCILQCLLSSVKSNSPGLLISDDVDMTRFNWPKDKVFEWFIGPLMIIKEQIKGLQLNENEEACLRNLIMTCNNEKPQDWDNTGFPSDDSVRRAQLQAIIRRLQGIVASMTRIPTFRRRFRNLVKVLYMEAIKTAASESEAGGGSSRSKSHSKKYVLASQEAGSSKFKVISNNFGEKGHEEARTDTMDDKINDNGSIV
ncbi:hypothetical protein BVC80_8899g14 [Macleaya cordata]|uniref:Transmembrane protein n=1 Tax=Macleaya cordata TaxID=56857 RepID=A0A200Q3S7_MACCD|nr:hypothetical protein BVC80_8899g14 [Macleaya cordata]